MKYLICSKTRQNFILIFIQKFAECLRDFLKICQNFSKLSLVFNSVTILKFEFFQDICKIFPLYSIMFTINFKFPTFLPNFIKINILSFPGSTRG